MIGKSLKTRRRRVGSKSHKSSGTGGVGGEQKSGCQEEEEGSKRRMRKGIGGGPVEGERGVEGKMTLTLNELIIQQLITRISKTPHFSQYIS